MRVHYDVQAEIRSLSDEGGPAPHVCPERGKKRGGCGIGFPHVGRVILFLRIASASSITPLSNQLRKLPSHSNFGMLLDADRKRLCTAASASLWLKRTRYATD